MGLVSFLWGVAETGSWKARLTSVKAAAVQRTVNTSYENSHNGQKKRNMVKSISREDDENVPDTESVWKVEYVFIEPLIKYTLGWPLHNKIHQIISNTGAEITHVPTMFTDLRRHCGRQRNKVLIHLSSFGPKSSCKRDSRFTTGGVHWANVVR